jgi:hypothetical protein
MNILTLDLGTRSGWAIYTEGKIAHGVANFSIPNNQPQGYRWNAFRKELLRLMNRSVLGVHAIYYEDVKNHGKSGFLAAHIYGGFLAHLEQMALLNHIPLHPVGVMTVKKHFAGTGAADKDMMMIEAEKRGYAPADHNAADALGILSLALHDQEIAHALAAPAAASSKAKKAAPAKGNSLLAGIIPGDLPF